MIIKSKHPEVIATMPEGWHLEHSGNMSWYFKARFEREGSDIEITQEPKLQSGSGNPCLTDVLVEVVQLCEDDYRSSGLLYPKNATTHTVEIRNGKMNNANVRNVLCNAFFDLNLVLNDGDPGIKREFFTGPQYAHTDLDSRDTKQTRLYLAASKYGTLTWEQSFYSPTNCYTPVSVFTPLFSEQARRSTMRQCPNHKLVAGPAETTVHAKPRIPRGSDRVLFKNHVTRELLRKRKLK